MLAVRLYAARDADATAEIFLRAIREVASRDYDARQIDAWAQIGDREAWASKRASRPTWIATYDGAPVGFADLEPTGHVDMMFVHPRYGRSGVASLLLTTIEKAAHDQGLGLLTTEASLTARPFFERRGFANARAQEVLIRGHLLRNFQMKKRFSAPPR